MSGDFYYDKVSVAMLVRLLLCLFNYLFDNSTIAMLAWLLLRQANYCYDILTTTTQSAQTSLKLIENGLTIVIESIN